MLESLLPDIHRLTSHECSLVISLLADLHVAPRCVYCLHSFSIECSFICHLFSRFLLCSSRFFSAFCRFEVFLPDTNSWIRGPTAGVDLADTNTYVPARWPSSRAHPTKVFNFEAASVCDPTFVHCVVVTTPIAMLARCTASCRVVLFCNGSLSDEESFCGEV